MTAQNLLSFFVCVLTLITEVFFWINDPHLSFLCVVFCHCWWTLLLYGSGIIYVVLYLSFTWNCIVENLLLLFFFFCILFPCIKIYNRYKFIYKYNIKANKYISGYSHLFYCCQIIELFPLLFNKIDFLVCMNTNRYFLLYTYLGMEWL